jgi:hypothetical protein
MVYLWNNLDLRETIVKRIFEFRIVGVQNFEPLQISSKKPELF